jgi:hypothetical protein
MPNDQNLAEMTAAASSLGWKKDQWPETFLTGDRQWWKRESTTARNGELQCVSYQD